MKRLILLAVCLCFVQACSKAPQNEPSAAPQATPKKYFYFVRKLDGEVSSLPPDLGDFKDAQRVEGEILGTVVQKSSAPQEKTKDGSKYIYTYFVTQGKEIELIDNAGLYHMTGSKLTVLVANIDKPDVPDIEFLQVGMNPKSNGKPPSGELTHFSLPSGGELTHLTVQTAKQTPGALRMLGELRWKDEGSELVSALRVKTDSGEVNIPLDQLVPFRKKTEKPTPSPGEILEGLPGPGNFQRKPEQP